MPEQKNYILAIVLSLAVLIAWQVLYVAPRTQIRPADGPPVAERPAPAPQTGPQTPGAPTPAGQIPGVQTPVALVQTREAALAQSPRLKIDTPALSGSINLKGGRIDDLSLKRYHETVELSSPNIVFFSPSGSPNPYYAELGWVSGTAGAAPGPETVWTASAETLTLGAPVTLSWDNGQGLIFRRTISVDDRYMFTVSDAVENRSGAAASLNPYGLVSRHGKPQVLGFFILHEGFYGVFGEAGLKEYKYDDVTPTEPAALDGKGGWFGITDKYWAATLIPDQASPYKARFAQFQAGATPTYQADFLREAVVVPAGETRESVTRLFAGAKEVKLVDQYSESLNVLRLDLMIDWGWFRFLTKPMFYALDWFYKAVGNFGFAILIVTILLKTAFLPLAYRSFVSMSKMKKFQPEMVRLKERYPDDQLKQRQALMDLYKKEKINPLSGCLPILLQIPVFFALYKVLFVTIEMRHAPFLGWIQDLSAPDPTSLFNLFGLIPWTPPQLLIIGAWPLLMGATMWVQMRLNPTPPDPVQQAIFNWMPVIFTYMLASFPAGLVIYWTWNNFLSIAQQWAIMRREGVDVDLWGNVASSFKRSKPKPEASSP